MKTPSTEAKEEKKEEEDRWAVAWMGYAVRKTVANATRRTRTKSGRARETREKDLEGE